MPARRARDTLLRSRMCFLPLRLNSGRATGIVGAELVDREPVGGVQLRIRTHQLYGDDAASLRSRELDERGDQRGLFGPVGEDPAELDQHDVVRRPVGDEPV